MWFIVFLICFGESLLCNAQQGLDNSHIAAEVDQPVQAVNWDNARPPVTLSIRDGRSNVENKPPNLSTGDDHPLFYSHEWQPYIMPIGFNHFGDPSSSQGENEYPVDPRFLPTFLRRPETDSNSSSAPLNAERDELTSTQVPFSPIMLYPNPFNLYPNGNSGLAQNSSTPQVLTSDSTRPNTEQSPNEIPPFEGLPFPDFPGQSFPFDFYRHLQGFTQPRARVYLNPYPVFPLPREDTLESIISPDFNRESGSDGGENIPPVPNTSEERPATSDDVPPESIPSETLPTAIVPPPLPLPFPMGAYPFGVVPPARFFPPLVPNTLSSSGQPLRPNEEIREEQPPVGNALPRSFPFNPIPFLRLTNIRPEAGDAVLPPPPVLPPVIAAPPLDPTNDLPQVDGLELPISIEGEDENLPKIPYEFGFDMNDGLGTDQHRKEVSDGSGVVTGSYGYRDLFGVYRLVNYIADKGGFRAVIKSNEPGVATSRSANVLVMAEPPPPHAVAEGITVPEPEVVIAAAEEPVDLTPAASENK